MDFWDCLFPETRLYCLLAGNFRNALDRENVQVIFSQNICLSYGFYIGISHITLAILHIAGRYDHTRPYILASNLHTPRKRARSDPRRDLSGQPWAPWDLSGQGLALSIPCGARLGIDRASPCPDESHGHGAQGCPVKSRLGSERARYLGINPDNDPGQAPYGLGAGNHGHSGACTGKGNPTTAPHGPHTGMPMVCP